MFTGSRHKCHTVAIVLLVADLVRQAVLVYDLCNCSYKCEMGSSQFETLFFWGVSFVFHLIQVTKNDQNLCQNQDFVWSCEAVAGTDGESNRTAKSFAWAPITCAPCHAALDFKVTSHPFQWLLFKLAQLKVAALKGDFGPEHVKSN